MLQNLRDRAKDESGFTLIELLVVILIIGILAALALPTFLGQRQKAQNSSAQSDARNMVSHVESCYTDTQSYINCDSELELGQTGLAWGAGDQQVLVLQPGDRRRLRHQRKVQERGCTFTITKAPRAAAFAPRARPAAAAARVPAVSPSPRRACDKVGPSGPPFVVPRPAQPWSSFRAPCRYRERPGAAAPHPHSSPEEGPSCPWSCCQPPPRSHHRPFLNVVAYRLPLRESLADAGPHCPSCDAPVKAYDNIPLLSWLLLRGRCRSCKFGDHATHRSSRGSRRSSSRPVVAVHLPTRRCSCWARARRRSSCRSRDSTPRLQDPPRLTAPAAVLALVVGTALDPGCEVERLIAAAVAAAR